MVKKKQSALQQANQLSATELNASMADEYNALQQQYANGSGGGTMTGLATVGGTSIGVGGGGGAIGTLPNTITSPQWQQQQWTVPNYPVNPNTLGGNYQPQVGYPQMGMMTEEQLDAIAGAVLKKVLKKLDSVKLEDRETLKRLLKGKI